MKNCEKYEKEIREFTVSNFGLFNGTVVRCGSIDCGVCEFDKFKNGVASCVENLTNWLYQEADIVVGDVVKHDLTGTLMYVTQLNGDDRISGVVIDTTNGHIGCPYTATKSENWIKTGKHIPLDKVIELIGGTN